MIDLIALGGMTITILTTQWVMFRSMRSEIKDVRSEIKDVYFEIGDARTEINAFRTEIKGDTSRLEEILHGMKERMAHFEGLLEGIRGSTASKSAA